MNQLKGIEKVKKQVDKRAFMNEQANTCNKKKETLTRKEIEELMGCNRQTYRRVGGAVRNNR